MRTCRLCETRLNALNTSGFCLKHRCNTSRARYNIALKLTGDELEARRVNRDPCTYCAVRADVGCKHNRWAA